MKSLFSVKEGWLRAKRRFQAKSTEPAVRPIWTFWVPKKRVPPASGNQRSSNAPQATGHPGSHRVPEWQESSFSSSGDCIQLAETQFPVVQNHIAASRVAVARLANAADVDHQLLTAQRIGVADFARRIKPKVLGENTPGTCVWPWKQYFWMKPKIRSIFRWL